MEAKLIYNHCFTKKHTGWTTRGVEGEAVDTAQRTLEQMPRSRV